MQHRWLLFFKNAYRKYHMKHITGKPLTLWICCKTVSASRWNIDQFSRKLKHDTMFSCFFAYLEGLSNICFSCLASTFHVWKHEKLSRHDFNMTFAMPNTSFAGKKSFSYQGIHINFQHQKKPHEHTFIKTNLLFPFHCNQLCPSIVALCLTV